jgi:hypothetical protein
MFILFLSLILQYFYKYSTVEPQQVRRWKTYLYFVVRIIFRGDNDAKICQLWKKKSGKWPSKKLYSIYCSLQLIRMGFLAISTYRGPFHYLGRSVIWVVSWRGTLLDGTIGDGPFCDLGRFVTGSFRDGTLCDGPFCDGSFRDGAFCMWIVNTVLLLDWMTNYYFDKVKKMFNVELSVSFLLQPNLRLFQRHFTRK